MAALKVAMASSSSSLCGKPHIVMDTWVRRIRTSSSCCSSSSSATRRKVGIRVLIEMTNTKGSTIINSKKGERMTVGWRMISCARVGGTQDKGLVGNWSKKSFSSQAKGFVADNMGSENKEQQNHHHHQQQQHQTQRLLTLPTILTIGRVAAVPLLVSTFYMNSQWATTVTTGIFIGAAITDWLDGYIARKMRLGTAFGAFLDPVADKLMVAATLVLLCTRPLDVTMFGEVPWLLPVPAIAIIGREITMSAVREWAASQNSKFLEAVAVNNLGKWKTATQMIALTILLATRDSSLIGSEILVPSGVVLLYVSAGLAVWSLAVYIKKIWRILLK